MEKGSFLCEFSSYVCFFCEGKFRLLSIFFLFFFFGQGCFPIFIPYLPVTENPHSPPLQIYVLCVSSLFTAWERMIFRRGLE